MSLLAGALLLAGPASALSTVYDMGGSSMSMVNQACPAPNLCTVAVTGTVTIDDDGAGNVLLTDLSLAHVGYEVAIPTLISVVIERSSIALGAGSVAGTGSTLTSVIFGATTLAQTGTATCTQVVFGCGLASLPDGVSPLPGTVAVNLGTWTFDGLGGLSASFVYTSVASPAATETLRLATVPEPGTSLLLAIGVVALALRRRAGF